MFRHFQKQNQAIFGRLLQNVDFQWDERNSSPSYREKECHVRNHQLCSQPYVNSQQCNICGLNMKLQLYKYMLYERWHPGIWYEIPTLVNGIFHVRRKMALSTMAGLVVSWSLSESCVTPGSQLLCYLPPLTRKVVATFLNQFNYIWQIHLNPSLAYVF